MILYFNPSWTSTPRFLPSPLFPLLLSKGETSQHPPAGWCFWNQERVLPVSGAVSIIGGTWEKMQAGTDARRTSAASNKTGVLLFALRWSFLFLSSTSDLRLPSLPSATGREVFDWILDQGYYSERDTSNVMRQVLEAVAYLHSLKIVHRNLKVHHCADT